jgi:ADP-ribose pyrophosphatase
MEVAEERVALPDGREIDGFLQVRTRDFVVIVAVTEASDVVLIRSYKHGPRAISLACPAGYIEGHEEPMVAAKRELLEETGYAARDWTSLGRFVVDGNYGVATEHIFLARQAERTADAASGDLEDIEVVRVPLAGVNALLLRGEVLQVSSAAALALGLLTLAAAG